MLLYSFKLNNIAFTLICSQNGVCELLTKHVSFLVSSNNHFYKPFPSDVINECDCKPTLIIKSAFHNQCWLAKFTGKHSCISFRPLACRLSCEETGIKPRKMNTDFSKPRVSLVEGKSFYQQLVKIHL